MIEKIESLNRFVKHLQQVPFLASRNLYKVVSHFLEMDTQQVRVFADSLIEAKEKVEKCKYCFFWKERSRNCIFCSDVKRNKKIICVVETWQDLLAVERTSGYLGEYHVLGGVICPLEGVGPESLTINQLVEKSERVDEIILALSQTPEGEATAAFIANRLENRKVRLTCLARGVPVGSSLQFMDRATLHQAMQGRKPF